MADFLFGSRGLVESLRGSLETALRIIEARLELLGIELQEEKHRLLGLAVLAAGMVVFAVLALVVLTVGLIALAWDNPALRHPVIWGIFAVYVALALVCWRTFASRVSKQARLFEGTIEELRKDRSWLRPR
jgi:uncharacterized membrane protein YqjE